MRVAEFEAAVEVLNWLLRPGRLRVVLSSNFKERLDLVCLAVDARSQGVLQSATVTVAAPLTP
jgi:hypothetical protein